MRNLRLLVLLLLALGLIVPTLAQDDTSDETEEATEPAIEYDCTTVGINRQIDAWYNDYIADRGQVEETQALEAAQTLATNITDLQTACGIEIASEDAGEEIEQTGIGTVDSPFIIQAAGVVGDSTLNITQSLLPANEEVIATGIAGVEIIPEGQEYFLLTVELICRQGSTVGCTISENSFRVIGVKGIAYAPTLTQLDDYFPRSRPLNGGEERTGVLPFLVDTDDTGLQLVYYPNGDGLQEGAFAVYFDATGSATSFELRSTTPELLIRSRPVSGAPVGVLRDEQTALALGRNEDASWIYIEAPEGTGWVSAEFVEADVELEELSVVDPDEVEQSE
ncbi:MAG: hypothetical protein AAF846_21970 [Chloroflexota bacterium]